GGYPPLPRDPAGWGEGRARPPRGRPGRAPPPRLLGTARDGHPPGPRLPESPRRPPPADHATGDTGHPDPPLRGLRRGTEGPQLRRPPEVDAWGLCGVGIQALSPRTGSRRRETAGPTSSRRAYHRPLLRAFARGSCTLPSRPRHAFKARG